MRNPAGPDPEHLHVKMIDRLVRAGTIRTPPVEQAFRAVRRHLFLPDVPLDDVYSGRAIPTRFGPDGFATSSSSEPSIMAIMLEQLQAQSGHRVLEIGAGTGYNAAILAAIAGPEGAVSTIDIEGEIVEAARRHLAQAGCGTVDVRDADGWLGLPDRAPYDRIEVSVGVDDLSPRWHSQLREGGILVAPLRLRGGLQASIGFQREGSGFRSLSVAPCGFMCLRGPHAGPGRFVDAGGWCALLETGGDEAVAVLRGLCGQPPRVEAAPPLLPGWFVPIALEDPGAITLSQRSSLRYAMGIFDPSGGPAGPAGGSPAGPAGGSLSVVEGRQLLTYGTDAARARILHRLIVEPRPTDLRTLRVEAVPTGTPPPPASLSPRRWFLARDHFQFVISA